MRIRIGGLAVFLVLAVAAAIGLGLAHRQAQANTTASVTPSVSPPDLTNGSGIYVLFSGPGADQVAGAFQKSAAKGGTYWPTFTQGPASYTISCHLHYGSDSAEVAKSNASFEMGIEGNICASLLGNGWHQ